MPGLYAHYRFAAEQLRAMDGEAKKVIGRFRQLYDVGAQGPDPLFYFNPFVKNEKLELSYQIQRNPGRNFFEAVCRSYRQQPTEGAYAYLLGCLTHFALDSMCHPFVWEQDRSGAGKHVALETEFNRFLLELDGFASPHTTDPGGYLTLTRGECETAAAFYPKVKGRDFSHCMGNMKLFSRLFAAPEGLPRNVVNSVTDKLGYGQYIMTAGPDPKHQRFNEPMLALYHRAAEQFPDLLSQLQNHLENETPLGEAFDLIYG